MGDEKWIDEKSGLSSYTWGSSNTIRTVIHNDDDHKSLTMYPK